MNGHQQHPVMDANSSTASSQQQQPPPLAGLKAPRNYKLLVDPCLIKGREKLYRYDGIVPNGDPAFQVPVQARDPRNQLARLRTRQEPLDLPVPR